MAEIAVAEFDDREVRAFLKNLKGRLKDIKDGSRKYMGLLSAIVYGDIMDHFKKQEGPNGSWPAWSALYREHATRAGKVESQNMLKWSGHLRQNFKPTDYRITNQGPLWYNNATTKSGFPYAFHHDEGAKKKRPFMWLSDTAMEKVEEQTLAFMLDEGI